MDDVSHRDGRPGFEATRDALIAEPWPLAEGLVERVLALVPSIEVDAAPANLDRLSTAVSLALDALHEPDRLGELARIWAPTLRDVGLTPTHVSTMAREIAGLVAALVTEYDEFEDTGRWTDAASKIAESLSREIERSATSEAERAIEHQPSVPSTPHRPAAAKRATRPPVLRGPDPRPALTDCHRRLEDLVRTLDRLCLKADMVSLGAEVEVARLGKRGRGVAVLVAELRELARRSGDVTREVERTLRRADGLACLPSESKGDVR